MKYSCSLISSKWEWFNVWFELYECSIVPSLLILTRTQFEWSKEEISNAEKKLIKSMDKNNSGQTLIKLVREQLEIGGRCNIELMETR